MNSNYHFYYGILTEIIALTDLLTSAQQQAGVFLAKADVTVPPVQAKYEYILYVQRYGSPPNGIFNLNLLNNLRIELGLPIQSA